MVMHSLEAHTGFRAVAGVNHSSTRQGVYLFAQGTHQRFPIAEGQVGTAHGTEEKQVARDKDAKILKIEAQAARRMAGGMDDLAVQRTPRDLALGPLNMEE